jgi:hypothetical protein
MTNAELSEPALGLLVSTGDDTYDGNRCRLKPAKYLTIEPAQIGGEQHGAAVSSGNSGQQIGDINAASCDFQVVGSIFQRGDKSRLPTGSSHGRQDRNGHCAPSGTTVK